MDHLRRLLGKGESRSQDYERVAEADPLAPGSSDADDQCDDGYDAHEEVPFSWLEYGIFALLGMAMLWAWYVVLQNPPNPPSRDLHHPSP